MKYKDCAQRDCTQWNHCSLFFGLFRKGQHQIMLLSYINAILTICRQWRPAWADAPLQARALSSRAALLAPHSMAVRAMPRVCPFPAPLGCRYPLWTQTNWRHACIPMLHNRHLLTPELFASTGLLIPNYAEQEFPMLPSWSHWWVENRSIIWLVMISCISSSLWYLFVKWFKN